LGRADSGHSINRGGLRDVVRSGTFGEQRQRSLATPRPVIPNPPRVPPADDGLRVDRQRTHQLQTALNIRVITEQANGVEAGCTRPPAQGAVLAEHQVAEGSAIRSQRSKAP
jgi:hypothetical protein